MTINSPRQQSLLFLMPLEVRLHIYRHLLPFSVYDEDVEDQDCPVRWYPGLCPNVLFVNRQIHYEASELLFKNNIFSIYVRHPSEARLPMDESRPSDESFVLFSWIHRSWAHPRNQRFSLSRLKAHPNLRDIRSLYLSVPEFDGLFGVDVFLQRTSRARFQGVSSWIAERKQQGRLSIEEELRMDYVKRYKEPVDEVGMLFQNLPKVKFLSLATQYDKYHISFLEFLLEEILSIRHVSKTRCRYFSKRKGFGLRQGTASHGQDLHHRGSSLMLRFQKMLESPSGSFAKPQTGLNKSVEEMYRLFQAQKTRKVLEHEDEGTYAHLDALEILTE